jgi:PAS domain S-box-containing protein
VQWWDVLYTAPLHVAPGLTLIVFYWVAAAVLGLGFKVTNIRSGVLQFRRIAVADMEGLRIQALTGLIAQVLMGTCLSMALAAGLFAAFDTTVRPPASANLGRALAVAVSIELVITAIAGHSFLVWLGRRLALRQIGRSGSIAWAVPVVVPIHPESLKITGWSMAAQDLFGWEASEAIGRTVSELLIPDSWRVLHSESIRRWQGHGELPEGRRAVPIRTKARGVIPIDLVLQRESIGDGFALMAYLYPRTTPTGKSGAEAKL